jgi:RNA polymerase sigma-70 factor (ECF subfamily)
VEAEITWIGSDLAAARAGDHGALGRVLQVCRAYLLTYANAKLDFDLAGKVGPSDLVQQSLLEAQQAFGRFDGSSEEELLRWLRRILKNNLLDIVRRYRHAAARSVDQEVSLNRKPVHAMALQQIDDHGSPLDGLLALEKSFALERGLTRLPAEARRVIELRHRHKQSFAEIGAELGKSPAAARKVWFRALKSLREELKRHEEFGSSC